MRIAQPLAFFHLEPCGERRRRTWSNIDNVWLKLFLNYSPPVDSCWVCCSAFDSRSADDDCKLTDQFPPCSPTHSPNSPSISINEAARERCECKQSFHFIFHQRRRRHLTQFVNFTARICLRHSSDDLSLRCISRLAPALTDASSLRPDYRRVVLVYSEDFLSLFQETSSDLVAVGLLDSFTRQIQWWRTIRLLAAISIVINRAISVAWSSEIFHPIQRQTFA